MNPLPIGYLIKRVQESFRVHMDAALEPHGLTASSYAALYHLRDGPRSGAQLARACWVTPQTMHRITADMLERGLIEQAGAQGRAILLKLSTQGTAALTQAEVDVIKVEARMIQALTERERAQLESALLSCHTALESGDDSEA